MAALLILAALAVATALLLPRRAAPRPIPVRVERRPEQRHPQQRRD